MRAVVLPILLAITAASIAAQSPGKTARESVAIDRTVRAYYLYIPKSIDAAPVPLVITLHGSGRDGRSLVDPWSDLAERERFIVAGPDSTDRAGWQVPADGPAFLYFLVEAVRAKHAIDPRRMYLFGHSAGASFALTMGLLESEYFAAAAAHAAHLLREDRQIMAAAPRKIPFLLFHGTRDPVVPIDEGRAARDALAERDFPAKLVEIPGHDHNYYGRSSAINREAWEFLKAQTLDADPHFQIYQ